jgi:diguanylate cyclase (GGDEF)-like protein
MHDPLTGPSNRTQLSVELEHLLAAPEPDNERFALLLLLDLDRFKEVNDTLGHQFGDLLIQQVGPRFRAQLSELDTLARLGGDEFAVVLPGSDAERAREVAERLLHGLERQFELDGSSVEIDGSIGIALYAEHGVDADTLLRRADVAMYAAKGSRTGCALYAPEDDRHSPERLALVADLRRAIEQRELVLHYQPRVDVRSSSGSIAACDKGSACGGPRCPT